MSGRPSASSRLASSGSHPRPASSGLPGAHGRVASPKLASRSQCSLPGNSLNEGLWAVGRCERMVGEGEPQDLRPRPAAVAQGSGGTLGQCHSREASPAASPVSSEPGLSPRPFVCGPSVASGERVTPGPSIRLSRRRPHCRRSGRPRLNAIPLNPVDTCQVWAGGWQPVARIPRMREDRASRGVAGSGCLSAVAPRGFPSPPTSWCFMAWLPAAPST